ncbi:hypothetical protein RHS01_06922 [Rhizoctonia solani]|uniref:Mid2 domain-containing protein n=1 Tax=Rhizoctonia solani TaxID=456999 RepID=A0A8H7I8A0_9AGAM|nr:hypothetical protein RHS01_06922 [Rhizoctonia solani]
MVRVLFAQLHVRVKFNLNPHLNLVRTTNQPNHDPGSAMSSTVKTIIGVMIGIFGLIIIFYVFMFIYLRRHGRSFVDFLFLRRGRVIEISHHHYYNQAEGGLDRSAQPPFQQAGSYNPYAFDKNQELRMPEPAHTSSNANWSPQTGPSPPSYQPPQTKM